VAGKRGTRSRQLKESTFLQKDVEDRPPQDRKYRFRDESQLDPDDQWRVLFKKKLLDSVESSEYLEEYRKDDVEVSDLGNNCNVDAKFSTAQEYKE